MKIPEAEISAKYQSKCTQSYEEVVQLNYVNQTSFEKSLEQMKRDAIEQKRPVIIFDDVVRGKFPNYAFLLGIHLFVETYIISDIRIENPEKTVLKKIFVYIPSVVR